MTDKILDIAEFLEALFLVGLCACGLLGTLAIAWFVLAMLFVQHPNIIQ